jgi:tripartite-type tricarboxylate transporter receptor subunit TctC
LRTDRVSPHHHDNTARKRRAITPVGVTECGRPPPHGEETIMKRRDFIASAAAAAFLAASAVPVYAQAYPNKPVRVIVPFAPGGGNDFVARVVMEYVSKELGQQFVIQNLPGANAAVGLQTLRTSAPDGYTLGITADSALAVNPVLKSDLPYNPARDFAPVAGLADAQLILVANPSIKVKNAKELVELAKKEPGKLRFGSGGIGNMTHLAVEQLGAQAGVTFSHIPYGGIGPATAGLLSGDVQFGSYSIQAVLPHINSGALVGLGLGEKMDILPQVPTFTEAGLPDYRSVTWVSLSAPVGTPPEIVTKLSDTVAKVLRDPAALEQLRKGGWRPFQKTPDELKNLIASETEKWRAIIKAAKIEVQ